MDKVSEEINQAKRNLSTLESVIPEKDTTINLTVNSDGLKYDEAFLFILSGVCMGLALSHAGVL